MPAPNLNDPEAQAEYQRQQEAGQRAGAEKAALDARIEDGEKDWTDTIRKPFEAAGGAIDDFFSAETVSGPTGGQWGQSGTAAAMQNAQDVSRGRELSAGANADARTFNNQGVAAGNRAAPTTSTAGADLYDSMGQSSRNTAMDYTNRAGQSATQQQQLAALNNFAKAPEGPSAAQAQLQAGSDAAQRSAMSMARSGRGAGDSASALRDAAFSNATTQGNVASQAATLRSQEDAAFKQRQLEALNAAMGGAGAIRGADAAAAQLAQGTRGQDLASQQQQANQAQFDTTTKLQQTQLNDQARQGLYNTAQGYQQLGQSGELGFSQLGQNALNSQADYELAQQQMQLDAAKANQSADLEKDSGISGMIGAAAGVLGMSDERQKKDVRAERALSKALGTLGNAPAYSYEYKDTSLPGTAPGRQSSSMAQDLERGPYGGDVVHETPNGKMVDYQAVVKLTPGALTELNHRLAALEKSLGKKAA